MNTKDLLYPLFAALCYSTNPVMVKLGLRSSNEPLLGAAIGMTASTIVYLVYFLGAGEYGNSSPYHSGSDGILPLPDCVRPSAL